MKSDKIIDAIGKLDDEIINQSADNWEKNKRKNRLITNIVRSCGVAAAACVCVGVLWSYGNVNKKDYSNNGGQYDSAQKNETEYLDEGKAEAGRPENNNIAEEAVDIEDNDTFTVAEAIYPTEYESYGNSLSDSEEGITNNEYTYRIEPVSEFVNETAKRLLINDDGDNVVYAPMDIYSELSILAELTDGNTRQEILNVLGNDKIETQRESVANILLDNYKNNNYYKNIMANSLWINNSISYNTDTLNMISDKYMASSFAGDMMDVDYSNKLKEWINKQSKGLVTNYTEENPFNTDTLLTMCSTEYFSAKWEDIFSKEETEEKTFYGTRGVQNVQMMHENFRTAIIENESFKAVKKKMSYGSLCVILPNENSGVEELLNSNVLDIVKNCDVEKEYDVDLLLPKFDVSSDIDLVPILKQMGINDAFHPGKSDFTPLSSEDEVYLNNLRHTVRVKIDEEGCNGDGAVRVLSDSSGTNLTEAERIDFHVDRPFIYVVTGNSGEPLFVGVINNI